jgi:hypothetical protein
MDIEQTIVFGPTGKYCIGDTLKTSPIEQGKQIPPCHPGLSSEVGLVVSLVCDRIVLLIR